MIRWTVFYPKTEGATFDHDYYRDKHIPVFAAAIGRSDVEVTRGIDGPHEASATVTFGSLEELKAALGKLDFKFLADDLPNYSTVPAQVQISETTG
ncbi:EthD family reductase [Candidatus Frankia nodulisporulans]|uniref:EthD family reductase n=1 Tax=Candidatus Frankia nodulisporulans TaxID=2060052 RepID=UPI0013D653AD|nr:EthD family reductase [Candidatus Frankia nodulisporulans]